MDPDLAGSSDVIRRAMHGEDDAGLTLFSALVGVTHEGSSSAASMRRNSPSESKTLQPYDEYAEV